MKKTWLVINNSNVIDPYKQLEKMFEDIPDDIVIITDGNEINQGDAAAMAYYRLQSEDMSIYERNELNQTLLKYGKLDAFAMVMFMKGGVILLGIALDNNCITICLN